MPIDKPNVLACWEGERKVVKYLFPEYQLYSLQQLKMDKGSAFFPLPPVVSGASAQNTETRKEIGSNFCCSLYGGEGRCSAENKHFRAAAWGAPFVTIPSTGTFGGIQIGRGLWRDECMELRGEVLYSTCLEVVLLNRVSLYMQKHR